MRHNLESSVAAHYSRKGLLNAILAGLEVTGGDPENPTAEHLAAVDEFHTAGRAMTLKALGMMEISAGMHVFDAGCGIGGTARVLAKEYGCNVTGLDLTPEYVEVADALTARMKLSGSCAFHAGSVLATPFEDRSFDAAVTFHVAMNIADRECFYSELARVLRPRAPLCVFDVMKGPTPGMVYPVPWAETAGTSFLKTPNETRQLLSSAGFEVEVEVSQREFAVEFFRQARDEFAAADRTPPLGLHLLTGENSAEKFANYLQALESGQIEPMIMIARRV